MLRRLVPVLALIGLLAKPIGAQDITYYVACSAAQAVTAAADLLHVEAGTDKGVLVWKVWVIPGTQTTAGFHQVVLRRTTSASTGGTAVTPSPLLPTGAAFTGIVRYGATGGGANGVTLVNGSYFVPTTTTSGPENQYVVYDATLPNVKPIRIVKG